MVKKFLSVDQSMCTFPVYDFVPFRNYLPAKSEVVQNQVSNFHVLGP